MRFTLCVPTRNRPAFVERLLRYYVQTGYQHALFIGDASDPAPAEQTRQVCERFREALQVRYFNHAGLNVMVCLEELSRAASSPYCTWVGDDDLLCTPGIDRCMACLEQYTDYAAAQGIGLLFQTADSRPYGPIGSVRGYPYAVLNADSATERLREHVATGMPSLHTAVRRTEDFRAIVGGFGRMAGARQGFIFDDVIPHCLAAVQGKVKVLDRLYLIRQAHDGIYRQVDAYDWITDPDWHPSYRVFHDRVVEELIRQDGLSAEQVHRVIKEAFLPYVAHALASAWRRQEATPPESPRTSLRALAKGLPGAKEMWRSLRGLAQRWRDRTSLSALLHPSSPYHADFMPVYRAVTTPPEGEDGRREFPEAIHTAMAVK